MKDVIWKHLKLLGLYNKRYRYLFCPTTQFAILWWDAFSSLELFWLAHPVRKTTFLKTCALCDVLSTNKVVCLDSKKYMVETEEGDSKPAAPGIRALNEGFRRFQLYRGLLRDCEIFANLRFQLYQECHQWQKSHRWLTMSMMLLRCKL